MGEFARPPEMKVWVLFLIFHTVSAGFTLQPDQKVQVDPIRDSGAVSATPRQGQMLLSAKAMASVAADQSMFDMLKNMLSGMMPAAMLAPAGVEYKHTEDTEANSHRLYRRDQPAAPLNLAGAAPAQPEPAAQVPPPSANAPATGSEKPSAGTSNTAHLVQTSSDHTGGDGVDGRLVDQAAMENSNIRQAEAKGKGQDPVELQEESAQPHVSLTPDEAHSELTAVVSVGTAATAQAAEPMTVDPTTITTSSTSRTTESIDVEVADAQNNNNVMMPERVNVERVLDI